MYGFNENGPPPEKSPHQEFSYEFYRELGDELKKILPGKTINTGFMCRGDKTISRISFTGGHSEPLHPDDWKTLKELAGTLYSEKITQEDYSSVTSENTSITFTEGDPEYDYTQTITITRVEN